MCMYIRFNRLLAKEAHSPSRGWPIRGGSPHAATPEGGGLEQPHGMQAPTLLHLWDRFR